MNSVKPDITINEITGRYDLRDKVYHLFIDKTLLPDSGWCDDIAFYDHAKNIIHFSCQGPGLSPKQVETALKICEKIQQTLHQ